MDSLLQRVKELWRSRLKKPLAQALKIVLAAMLAIEFAELLRLKYAVSAGIVAILSVQPTKTETVYTALGRFYAFINALLIAAACFGVFGVSISAFYLFLALYIPVCHFFGWHAAMAMNSVLISHFLSEGVMNLPTVMNEVLIFATGVTAGILANLNLRKKEAYIAALQRDADEQVIRILTRMAERVTDREPADYNGDCFLVLRSMIWRAREAAEENYKNQFKKEDTFDLEYVAMREQQCQVLFEMYKSARELDGNPATAKVIADFLRLIVKTYGKENDGSMLKKVFIQMDQYMKQQPLPVSRREFEDRARLFAMMRHIEEFLQIKIDFAKKYGKIDKDGMRGMDPAEER